MARVHQVVVPIHVNLRVDRRMGRRERAVCACMGEWVGGQAMRGVCKRFHARVDWFQRAALAFALGRGASLRKYPLVTQCVRGVRYFCVRGAKPRRVSITQVSNYMKKIIAKNLSLSLCTSRLCVDLQATTGIYM